VDKYSVSWQITTGEEESITPFLLFVGDVAGKASAAMDFYTSIFKNSKIVEKENYKEDAGEKEGSVKMGKIEIENQMFQVMDSGKEEHKFRFTEGNSFLIDCENQEEVDYYWGKLIEGGSESVCGWCKDKFGLSWQVVPKQLNEWMGDIDKEKAGRVMRAFMPMKKIIVEDLKKAFENK